MARRAGGHGRKLGGGQAAAGTAWYIYVVKEKLTVYNIGIKV